ncbi:MAG: Trk family potassium uptake protein [Chloroflexi bacterium]|nr:Trk family potassium uptake protein [Chloroflexota bacterium]
MAEKKAEREGEQFQVTRTHRLYRPRSKVVRLEKRTPGSPRAVGVTGVVLGFAALIAVGTALLSLPAARAPGSEWDLVNTLFTAISAVCLTGLVVVDTGTYWAHFGQAVILGLIQAGGLGVMTASMLLLIILRQRISFRDRFDVYEESRAANIRSVGGLIFVTVLVTLLVELLGAAAIWYRLAYSYADKQALWRGLFHSISAFNNAGFDTMGGYTSLTSFARDPVLLMVVAFLFVSGGLGVLVLLDIIRKHSWRGLSPNSKMVLLASALLLALGMAGILALESTNSKTLGSLSLADKLSNAFFHSAAPRTAGFNTLPIGDLRDETLFLTTILMFIGGATGSTAGGVKVATLTVLILATLASVRGYEHTSGFGRRFSHRLVYRALALVTLSMTVVVLGTFILIITEDFPFRQVLFEVVSAFGTVGLTTGITPDLSVAGKLTIGVLMFVGRLGPLTVAAALAQGAREPRYQLPEGEVPLG